MPKEIINPADVSMPTGYSHAVKKSGTPVFISGQVALDGEGHLVGENDIAAQAEQVYRNLRAVVQACGGSLDDVVKITVFTTDLSYRSAIGAARGRFFTEGAYPASTFLVISSLARPEFLLEIEAIAMID